MQTNVQVDHDLVSKAMRLYGAKSESEAVEAALRAAVKAKSQLAILELRGIGWDGDLEEMRLDKPRRMID